MFRIRYADTLQLIDLSLKRPTNEELRELAATENRVIELILPSQNHEAHLLRCLEDYRFIQHAELL